MLDASEHIIYIGKAKNLKKRVSSYFQKTENSKKNKVMIAQVANIRIVLTNNEHEALILEQQWIKKYHPRYNILFKDDKSYLYIQLTDDPFPRLLLYRGRPTKKGIFFGPFTGSRSARYSLRLMQKLFMIRDCENSAFQYRSSPCLAYQIKRCSAPCVNKISHSHYLNDTHRVALFYQGKKHSILHDLNSKMENASKKQNFELATRYRDQMIHLKEVLKKQNIDSFSSKNTAAIDILSYQEKEHCVLLFVLTIRENQIKNSYEFFPDKPKEASKNEILIAFFNYYYHETIRPEGLPDEIVTNLTDEFSFVFLSKNAIKKKVKIIHRVKTEKLAWLKMANNNALQIMKSYLQSKKHQQIRVDDLKNVLSMKEFPIRMVCFDISHLQGEATIASCVVFENGEAKKKEYRRFTMNTITNGDDYAAIKEAVERYMTHLLKHKRVLPHLWIIDGGKGQLNQAKKALESFQLEHIPLISVAKGYDRRVGMEKIFSLQRASYRLPEHSPALHLIQAIRDEAHRFAIMGHRNKRDQKRKTSILEKIPGIGSERCQRIFQHFGGLHEVMHAEIHDLEQVKGINNVLAALIYQYFHE
jgi:excinuclease ABC subunit C